MLIETMLKVYERMRASPAGNMNLDKPGESETPPTNDNRGWDQPGPSSQPPGFTYTPAPLSATSGGTTVGDRNLVESNLLEPNSTQGFGLGGVMNLDQMRGIELFFSQPMCSENVLAQVGESSGGETGAFHLGDLFGLYDAQHQL